MQPEPPYDAILLMSFGGPEGHDDVMPYLDNVLRGKNVPEERKLEVAEHYHHFGGVSPINQQNRDLIAALQERMAVEGPDLPVYFGNRNWRPFIDDVMREMTGKGHRRVLAVFTSAYSCYSGCRQYRENIQAAREKAGPGAPRVDKVRVFHNHPGFIEANADHVRAALDQVGGDLDTLVLFTAHSIPMTMAETSNYEQQLLEACKLVAEAVGLRSWRLVYQSRSGPPQQPWLEPDVCDVIGELPGQGVNKLVLSPIGFISDHLEVMFDLDEEAAEVCQRLGIAMARAASAGLHPAFVSAVHELIRERVEGWAERRALGEHGPWHDVCPEGCCPPPARRRPAQSA